jgi:hypothetical protein
MSAICQRKHAISLLFSNDPDLLDFFFTRDHQSFGSGIAPSWVKES